MINPLQKLTDTTKKLFVLKALKQATERYKSFKKERNKYLILSFCAATSFATVVWLLNYYFDNAFIDLLNVAFGFVGFFGFSFCGALYLDRYQNAKKAWKEFTSLDCNNEENLLEKFQLIDYYVSNSSNLYEFFKWEQLDKTLSNEDIKTILNTKLTQEQRDYIKNIVYRKETLTYKHLLELYNLFSKSKEVMELNKNNTFSEFLKENNLNNIDTKEFFNTDNVELKEVELEAEYKRIL